MSSAPIKKRLYSLIFLLLICFSMLFGTAANGSETYHVPSGETTYGRSVRVTWAEPPNRPIGNKSTSWSVSPNNGVTLEHAHRTDGDGYTWFRLTFGANACGTYTVTMWLPDHPPGWSTYQARIVYGEPCSTGPSSEATEPTKLFIVSGDNQTGIIGEPLADPFVVRVRDRDQDNKPLEGVKVTFTVLTGGGSLSTTTTTTDISGLAKSTLTLGNEPGTNTVEVRAEGVSKEVTFSAEATLPPPVPTSLLSISNDNQTGPTGEALATPFVVEVRDQHGDPMEGVTVTFAVTAGDSSLSAKTATTDANGQAATTLHLGAEAGANTVEVSVEGISERVTFIAEAMPPTLTRVSGNNQIAVAGTTLAAPFVVEVRDGNGTPLAGVAVTFVVRTGDGTLSVGTTTTDANGQAASMLHLGTEAGANTVQASAEGISDIVTFTAVAELLEFNLSLSPGFNLIHIPLKVSVVNGEPATIQSVSDLYDALGGADTVDWLLTRNPHTQQWDSYFGDTERGTTADSGLTDQTGILANMRAPKSIRLSGSALGTDGSSTITLNPGLNLVGLPLNDSRITRVSDLFTIDGIRGNASGIILTDDGEFKLVGRAGDPGDIPVRGGQGFIISVQRAAEIRITGDGWSDNSEGL